MPALPRKKLVPLAVAAVVAVVLLVGGVFWWVDKSRWEATENAYVQADTVVVSPQLTGYVAEVLVTDNQRVTQGQELVRLDPAEARAALLQAEANVAAAEAAVRNVDDRERLGLAQVEQAAAGVSSARAQAQVASTDLARYDKLADSGWVSPQRLQVVRAGADEARAGVAQAAAALEAQRRQVGALASVREQSIAQVEQARAALEQARINLDRTVIRAPVAGVVGARAVRPGQYVRPGGAMLSVVPLGQTYIVANFKETQVGRMRVGQRVEIHADAFPGQVFYGRVESFAPATGSEFAMIPVENDTGNFTKITQRVPVKIALEPGSPLAAALRPGLSVSVKVDLKSRGGVNFAQSGQQAAGSRYAVTTPRTVH